MLLVSTAPVEVTRRRPKDGQHLIFTENAEDEQAINNTEEQMLVNNRLVVIICMLSYIILTRLAVTYLAQK